MNNKRKIKLLLSISRELNDLINFKNEHLKKNSKIYDTEPEYLDHQSCHELQELVGIISNEAKQKGLTERLWHGLEFYGLEAHSIAKNFGVDDEAVVTSLAVLKIDAGSRAFNLLNEMPQITKQIEKC